MLDFSGSRIHEMFSICCTHMPDVSIILSVAMHKGVDIPKSLKELLGIIALTCWTLHGFQVEIAQHVRRRLEPHWHSCEDFK